MSPKGRVAENFMICSQPPTPRHHDEGEDDWTMVCCHCQDIMLPDDTWSCCRCTHKFHHECRHICNDEIVCGHCKRDHFLPGQPYEPPLSYAKLLSNISRGVAVAGTPGTTPLAVAVLCSARTHDDASIKESTQVRPTSLGTRNAEELAPALGLELEESEAKARKTMMIHSVNIQQQVVLLQAVVQRFEVQ
eukprot:2397907-Amphidinium_carterae.1